LELRIPKLRAGSFFPSLLERRRRVDQALFAVVMEAYLHGVSTRKVDDLVRALGADSGISKSEVSRICADLDSEVAAFRDRSLAGQVFPYVFVDATYCKARVNRRVVAQAVVVATGVCGDGRREVLGFAVGDSEDGAFWTQFLRSLKARGLGGVQLVIADAHLGLRQAVGAVMVGAAVQRCRVHFLRNVLAQVPKGSAEMVAAAIRTIFAQPDAHHVHEQLDVIAGMLGRQFPKLETMLRDAAPDLLAFTSFPPGHWKKLWSTNPLERLNKEIKRRTDVVGVFPNPEALLRLAGAVLVEAHDEWQVSDRRYPLRRLHGPAHRNHQGGDASPTHAGIDSPTLTRTAPRSYTTPRDVTQYNAASQHGRFMMARVARPATLLPLCCRSSARTRSASSRRHGGNLCATAEGTTLAPDYGCSTIPCGQHRMAACSSSA
jgi:transposase-like protein